MFGGAWTGTLLGEIQATTASDGVVVLKLSDFPALQQTNGSIRVSVDAIVDDYPAGAFYPIIINRGAGNTFYALSSRCTHRDCVIYPFNGTAMICPCHAAAFSINGTVTKGPATVNLDSYPVTYDGVNTLQVTIPGLAYSITRCVVTKGTSDRLRIEFPTFDQVEYEIRFRQTFSHPWSVVPFALTLAGTADNTFLTGDGLPKTVFIDRTTSTGFYVVAIRLKPV